MLPFILKNYSFCEEKNFNIFSEIGCKDKTIIVTKTPKVV